MAKLEIARQNIFASTNKDGDTFYYLILGTSTYGCIHIKIRNVSAFRNIIGLKIDNLGYACINNIQHTPWRKFNFKKTVNYRRLSDQEYSLITNAIHDYMNGNIGFANDNTMMYMDEIARYNADLANKVEESFEDTIDGPSIVSNKTSSNEFTEEKAGGVKESNMDMENNEVLSEPDTICEEEPAMEEVDIVNNETSVVEDWSDEENNNKNITVINTVDHDVIDNDNKKSGIDLIPAENIEIEEPKPAGVKCYNLVTTASTKPYYVKSKDAARKSTTQIGRKVYRHIFTEDETFEIAHMDIKCIVAKYKVSNSIASHMRATAMKVFDLAVKEHSCKNDFVSLFKMGLSIEEVVEKTGANIGNVRFAYKSYMVNTNANNDIISNVYNKWIDIINNNDIDTLTSVAFKSVNKFAEEENITNHNASKILNMIRDHIFKNPMLVIGLDANIAYNKKKIAAYIEELRSNLTNNRKKNDGINAKVWVIEKALSLEEAYISSYDDHVDIMHGIKPIPESVSDKDRDAFITMIANRFYYIKMRVNNRNYTTDQKYVMSNNSSSAEYTMAFMCINDSKIKAMKSRTKRSFENSNSMIETAT